MASANASTPKSINAIMCKSKLIASLALSTFFGVAPAHAVTVVKWTALDLGGLSQTSLVTRATGINDLGQVTGYSSYQSGRYHAFLTGANGTGIRDIGTLGYDSYAAGLNNQGQVVGYYFSTSTGGYRNGFVTGANGQGMTAILGFGGGATEAQAINDAGQIVGTANIPGVTGGYMHAFFMNSSTAAVKDLNSVVTAKDGSILVVAKGINNAGEVAVSTNKGGLLVNMATQPASNTVVTIGANGINNSGQVIGGDYSGALTGAHGSSLYTLDVLDPSGWPSTPYDLNDAGQVVGESNGRAFMTGANGQGSVDLNSLVSIGDGAFLYRATGINNSGQIIAWGNNFHSYLLSSSLVEVAAVPEPETAGLALVALAFFGLTARRQRVVRFTS